MIFSINYLIWRFDQWIPRHISSIFLALKVITFFASKIIDLLSILLRWQPSQKVSHQVIGFEYSKFSIVFFCKRRSEKSFQITCKTSATKEEKKNGPRDLSFYKDCSPLYMFFKYFDKKNIKGKKVLYSLFQRVPPLK